MEVRQQVITRDDPGPVVAPTQVSAGELIRSLSYRGFGPTEAGNIVALGFGLPPIRGGWSGREIDHLRFVREVAHAASREQTPAGHRAPAGQMARGLVA